MLAETEATIAELKVRVAEYEKRADEAAAKVKEIPEVESKLKQLDRDYGAISAHHRIQPAMLRRVASSYCPDPCSAYSSA